MAIALIIQKVIFPSGETLVAIGNTHDLGLRSFILKPDDYEFQPFAGEEDTKALKDGILEQRRI